MPRRPTPALVGIGAVVAALAVVGSLILFSSQPPKLLASACGAGGCRHGAARTFGGAQPPNGGPAPAHKASRRSHPTATHSTARPSPTPTSSHPTSKPRSSSPGPQPTSSSPAPTPTSTAPGTTPTPSPTPTASPTQGPVQVSVSYAVVSQHPHSFQGKFTIVNEGSTAIKGWELAVVLPGDQIRSVWDGRFRTNGDTMYIDPSSSQRTIAPGATVTENFTAHGTTTTLTSCTFNGAAC